ncbi:lipoprotein [Myxococcus stipitatus DSM 14675]|uniref:Lipoprotein n=1 Tax=Myxococcus stipitatus (strain DSM 14675 / JCM 12634 / Mx s8) TaxID=1278073 RepID=L7UH19_MYXSD|nr:hypothetical protein [Myxococcus stipitatus]AGC47303.1 lipoprotein [Myxococcus stipitatus DSM 14675]
MKTAMGFGVLLSLLAVGCGNSDDGEDGGGGSALQCSAVGWCSTWYPTSREVANPPALTGGTLADGLYRMAQGSHHSQAMLIQGKSILLIGRSWSNFVGTWKADGGKLTVSVTGNCDELEEKRMTTQFTYAFAVQGNTVYLQDLETEGRPVLGFQKVSSLCEETATFTCDSRICSCITTTNKPLTGQTSCD